MNRIGRGSGKKARRKHAAIVFIDETGFSFRCRPGTTWAPTGRTPILRRVSKRREVSTAVALTLSGRIYKRHFDHAVHGPDVVVFLRHLQRYLPGPLMVIWDRLQAHRSAEVKVYRGQHPEIMVEELPTYAPDLNPEEGCHGDVKRHLLNATPEDTRQIKEQANRGSLMSGFRVVIPGGQRDRYNLPRGEAVHVLGPDLVVHRRGPGHARSHPEPHR